MKQYTHVTTGLLLASLVLVGAGCMNKTAPAANDDVPQIDEAAVSIESGVYQIQSSQSLVEWFGKKRVGASHDGSVDLAYGQVTFDAMGTLVNGTFTIDMTTINSYENIDRLVSHLNSADFFDTENHREATFVLTRSDMTAPGMYTVTGDLTIKGITNEVTFPARIISESEGTVRAIASMEINRASYDVRFGSPSFFNDLGDALIEDTITFDLNIVATKVSDIGGINGSPSQDIDETDTIRIDAEGTVEVDVVLEPVL
jgi:polyisoprenoid-binding protein YceI